jgi:hypothetical protein
MNLAPAANRATFTSAATFSYVIHTRWSFSGQLYSRTLFRFVIVAIAGSLMAVFASGIVDDYSMHYLTGITGVVCTVPPLIIILHKHWTYNKLA